MKAKDIMFCTKMSSSHYSVRSYFPLLLELWHFCNVQFWYNGNDTMCYTKMSFSSSIMINIAPWFQELLSPRFFKKASGILQSPPSVRPSVRLSVRPSVCPSRYLLLNRWTKFNQIWCVSCSHGKGVQRHIFFWPRPLGPWGGAKRSNIIKYH